jgi:CheY-like chemotaxis protein
MVGLNGNGERPTGDYVLVVDDDPDVRRLIVDALALFGLQGLAAVNGQDALHQIRENPPMAVILDLMMPSMNGFSVITHLRRQASSRSIPVIVMSGISDTPGRLGRLPGVVGVMPKGSFSIAQLRTLLSAAGLAA